VIPPRAARRFLLITCLLGLVAFAGRGGPDNGDLYRQIGRDFAVLDCVDIQCFRILVPIVVEHLPGPSLFKWKAYAVLTSAVGAVVTGRLCLVLGLSVRAAILATWIAGFGYGPLQSIFDPYTADPLMYLLGPWLMADLLQGRLGRSTLVASVGVLAKEFAAAPMWIFAGLMTLKRQWDVVARAALAALAVTTVWFALQTTLMMLYNNSYGNNPSVDLLGGGYFRTWVAAMGRRQAVLSLVSAFGPLYLLMAVGLRRPHPTLRLMAIAALPAAAAFVYVQQPDRALWNFHFVVIPLAMLALEALPDRLCWPLVITYGAANLRLTETQPPPLVVFRFAMLAVSMALAGVAVAASLKREATVRSDAAPRTS